MTDPVNPSGLGADASESTARTRFAQSVLPAVLTVVAVAVVLVGVGVFQLATEPQARCDGELMGPGDQCVSYRAGTSQTTAEVLGNAENFQEAMLAGVGAGLVATIIAMVAVLLCRPPTDPGVPPTPGASWYAAPVRAHPPLLAAAIGLTALTVAAVVGFVLGGIGWQVLLAVIPAVGAGVFWVAAWPTPSQLVRADATGLAVVRRPPASMIAWSAIEGVRQDGTKIPTITIEHDRTSTTLGPGLSGVDVLAGLLRRDAEIRRQPRQTEALRSGATVDFGAVSIAPAGLVVGRRTVAWSEVTSLLIKDGSIQVIGRDGPVITTVAVTDVVDLPAFLSAARAAITASQD